MIVDNAFVFPVQFSSYEGHFVMTPQYCANPDCPSRDVHLHFQETSEKHVPLKGGIAFSIHLDIDTKNEIDSPARSKMVERMVKEFLEEIPEELLAKMRESLEWHRNAERRLSTYRIDIADIRDGALVAYSDIVYEEGSLATGGSAYGHTFHHKGRCFLVEEMYCPVPECRCKEISLNFFEKIDDPSGSCTIRQLFLGTISLKGRMGVREAISVDRTEAEELLRAFIAARPGLLAAMKDSLRVVKGIAKRSLRHESEQQPLLAPQASMKIPPFARSNSPTTHSRAAPFIPESKPGAMRRITDKTLNAGSGAPGRQKVGRNEPCPCGSGKKFKKCCCP